MDFELYGPNGELVRAKASPEGGLLVTPTFSPEIELARRGNGVMAITTTAVAGLVVRPSTVALGTLVNNEPGGGKSYILDAALAFNLVSGAAQGFHSIWLCVHPVGRADTITNNITARGNMTGKPITNPGQSIFGIDDTVTDDGWFPWGPIGEAEEVGVLPNGALEAPINGKIILPPTAALSIHVVASTVNEDFTVGFRWYEEQMAVNTG